MSKLYITCCDGCGGQRNTNPNYSQPNDWIKCSFSSNGRKKEHIDFCSRECLKKYITSESLGNDIGHNIKDAQVSDGEVRA